MGGGSVGVFNVSVCTPVQAPKCVHSREFGASVTMPHHQWRAVGSSGQRSYSDAGLGFTVLLQETRAENC